MMPRIGFDRLTPLTYLTVLLTLGVMLPASAQEGGGEPLSSTAAAPRPRTTLDEWLRATGVVLVKDFYEVGRVSGDGRVSVDAAVFTRRGAETTEARGLRIEILASGKPERYETSYVDFDEIAGLSRALHALADMAAKWKDAQRPQYTEVEFSSRGSLKVGFYQRRREQGAFIAAGPAPAAHAFLDARELPRLRALVDEGLKMLKGR